MACNNANNLHRTYREDDDSIANNKHIITSKHKSNFKTFPDRVFVEKRPLCHYWMGQSLGFGKDKPHL